MVSAWFQDCFVAWPAPSPRQPRVMTWIAMDSARDSPGPNTWLPAATVRFRSLRRAYDQVFLGATPVHCSPVNLDQYGRTVATCSVNGIDLGGWLVSNGLALDWPHLMSRDFR